MNSTERYYTVFEKKYLALEFGLRNFATTRY